MKKQSLYTKILAAAKDVSKDIEALNENQMKKHIKPIFLIANI